MTQQTVTAEQSVREADLHMRIVLAITDLSLLFMGREPATLFTQETCDGFRQAIGEAAGLILEEEPVAAARRLLAASCSDADEDFLRPYMDELRAAVDNYLRLTDGPQRARGSRRRRARVDEKLTGFISQIRYEAEADAKAENILKLLDAHAVATSPEQRQQISSCADLVRLETCGDRAITAATADEILTG